MIYILANCRVTYVLRSGLCSGESPQVSDSHPTCNFLLPGAPWNASLLSPLFYSLSQPYSFPLSRCLHSMHVGSMPVRLSWRLSLLPLSCLSVGFHFIACLPPPRATSCSKMPSSPTPVSNTRRWGEQHSRCKHCHCNEAFGKGDPILPDLLLWDATVWVR